MLGIDLGRWQIFVERILNRSLALVGRARGSIQRRYLPLDWFFQAFLFYARYSVHLIDILGFSTGRGVVESPRVRSWQFLGRDFRSVKRQTYIDVGQVQALVGIATLFKTEGYKWRFFFIYRLNGTKLIFVSISRLIVECLSSNIETRQQKKFKKRIVRRKQDLIYLISREAEETERLRKVPLDLVGHCGAESVVSAATSRCDGLQLVVDRLVRKWRRRINRRRWAVSGG